MLNILILDSGVGGLSISQSLTEYLPYARQILLADNEYFPYGEMDEEILITRVTDILIRSVQQFQPDCIVIACNTVSTVALDKIRSTFSIPVIGVVPAIKPAAAMSQSKVIGLLATPATINRSYTADLVDIFADDCVLIAKGSTRLVEIAEQRLVGQQVDIEEVKTIVETFIQAEKEQNLDTLVLGCTHFPLLTDILIKIFPESITLIDSSNAIAQQVQKVLTDSVPEKLKQSQLPIKQSAKVLNRYVMTRRIASFELEEGLNSYGFSGPEFLV